MVNYQSDPDMTESSSSESNVIEVIETVIDSLDQSDSAMVNETDGGHLWKFKYGSVEVFVQLTGETDEDTFTVWSTVLPLPAQNEPQLMKKLLEMNWMSTFEACFGIFNNQIVVLSSRTVAELSPGEVSRLITVVATIADDNDESLQSEFGMT
ncbi:MAG: YbjN domain-containing protein [Myxacorys californica WJT36-NPBG1]|jgi:hypothetical protein|nr:YbjN domain-containing protein [Myxacorys californica WJT36-NPBG1]